MSPVKFTREEWIKRAVHDLDQAAAMLLLEAQEWRDRAMKREPPRDKAQMVAIAATDAGMAKQLTTLALAGTELLQSEASITEEGNV